MIEIFLLALIVYTVISLLTNVFVFGKYRAVLYVLIPLQLAFAIFGYVAVEKVKGYATTAVEELEKEFVYISHYEEDGMIYLLAIPDSTTEPRLYVFDLSKDADKLKKMQEALEAAANGAQEGWIQRGSIYQNEPSIGTQNHTDIAPKQESSDDNYITP